MKNKTSFENSLMKSVLFVFMLMAVFFTALISNQAKAEEKDVGAFYGDPIESKSFTLGDSVLTADVSPNYESFVETYDSTGNGTDTFKVYIVSPSGAEKLAELKRVNTGSDSTVYSTGVIINGDGGSSIWKVVWSYPYQLKVVRTNASSLTSKVSKASIRSVLKPSGMNSLPYDFSSVFERAEKRKLLKVYPEKFALATHLKL